MGLSCRWWLKLKLKLKHLKLLLESGDRRCPLFELKVLLLHDMLEVYDRMDAGVHLLTGEV
jgi:hypothetical protein